MSVERIPLMAHLVAGYPDVSGCRAAARGLVEGGATYLEVQIPFSDPSADGPTIRDACSSALEKGSSVKESLALVADLHATYPEIPVFVMTYASLVFAPGIVTFVDAAAKAGAAGLIVPDLPFDADEGLAQACVAASEKISGAICSIPVAAPSMKPIRLAAMIALGRPYIYAALRAGITGAATEVNADTKMFLSAVNKGGSKIFGGFGIRSSAQARAVAPYVHAVVAGSVFVEAISAVVLAQSPESKTASARSLQIRNEAIRRAVYKKAKEIIAG
ncbi:MAG: tryptophan synthase subunit alpha [Rectinema subterraneum]|uniref:tryptophan synthase subunit alpha n=1 Tax=Rectinema subterraneum TaxID=2653714 RepID=UPI003C7B734B